MKEEGGGITIRLRLTTAPTGQQAATKLGRLRFRLSFEFFQAPKFLLSSEEFKAVYYTL
jgi:hypothetical protein